MSVVGVFRAALAALLVGLAPAIWAQSTPARVVLPDDVAPRHYDLSVRPDAKALTFSGHVAIDLDVKRETGKITLNAADIGFDKVALEGRDESPEIAADAENQTATFSFRAPIAAGPHRLVIDYHGKIYQQASGLFALDFTSAEGKARALFTQFENSDARRFFPGFDEPGLKATFTLHAEVPSAEMAISNMPQAGSEDLPNAMKRVTFAETP
jgi:aminopeptidase N